MATSYSDILDAAKAGLLALMQRRVASYQLWDVQYTYQNIEQLERVIRNIEPLAAREAGTRPRVMLADISGRPS